MPTATASTEGLMGAYRIEASTVSPVAGKGLLKPFISLLPKGQK